MLLASSHAFLARSLSASAVLPYVFKHFSAASMLPSSLKSSVRQDAKTSKRPLSGGASRGSQPLFLAAAWENGLKPRLLGAEAPLPSS